MTRIPVAPLTALLLLCAACAPRAIRGGPGTDNPAMDEAAMSVLLDRADIEYLVGENLGPLFGSRFWAQDVAGAPDLPLVAIWPIQNATTQHIDDQMLTVLSSIETKLVNSGAVRVVDRARQEALAREIGIQQSDIYDPVSARRLGRQLGAQYFVTGKVTSVEEKIERARRVQYTLFLQVVEIETGLIEFQHESARSKALQR
jgi:PBP1b-binding outer membrane lipoprotein LpoB